MSKTEDIKDPVAQAVAGAKVTVKKLEGKGRREVERVINGEKFTVIIEDGIEKR